MVKIRNPEIAALYEQYGKAQKDLADLKKTAEKNGQKLFKNVLKEFFESTPEVRAIKWRQYTPYFNDGDVCTFSVNPPDFHADMKYIEKTYGLVIEADEDDDGDERNDFAKPSKWVYEGAKENSGYASRYQAQIDAYENLVKALTPERMKEIQENIDNVNKLFREISDEVFLMAFGDHAEIVATKKGIDVDEGSIRRLLVNQLAVLN